MYFHDSTAKVLQVVPQSDGMICWLQNPAPVDGLSHCNSVSFGDQALKSHRAHGAVANGLARSLRARGDWCVCSDS